jgi:hypothetical protein
MLLTRWVRTQQRRWAFFLALALWAQAMSVLGYALALMVTLPLVAIVALVRRRPSPFDDRPFYDGVAITAFVLLILVSIFLGPAIEVRTSDAFTSMYEERHEGGAQLLPYLFPGVVVLLLAAVYGFFQRQMLFKHVRAKRPGQIIITALALARVALWLFVGITCAGRAAAPDAVFWETLGRLVGGALVAILALTFVLALAARRAPRAFGTALMHGLGLAAAACFIASLGPQITVGSPSVNLSQGPLPGPGTVHAFLASYRSCFWSPRRPGSSTRSPTTGGSAGSPFRPSSSCAPSRSSCPTASSPPHSSRTARSCSGSRTNARCAPCWGSRPATPRWTRAGCLHRRDGSTSW